MKDQGVSFQVLYDTHAGNNVITLRKLTAKATAEKGIRPLYALHEGVLNSSQLAKMKKYISYMLMLAADPNFLMIL